jgi:hypothetical protein
LMHCCCDYVLAYWGQDALVRPLERRRRVRRKLRPHVRERERLGRERHVGQPACGARARLPCACSRPRMRSPVMELNAVVDGRGLPELGRVAVGIALRLEQLDPCARARVRACMRAGGQRAEYAAGCVTGHTVGNQRAMCAGRGAPDVCTVPGGHAIRQADGVCCAPRGALYDARKPHLSVLVQAGWTVVATSHATLSERRFSVLPPLYARCAAGM